MKKLCKKKLYEYLVAYHVQRDVYTFSLGASQILMDKKINSYDDIINIQQRLIKQIEGASNISIYNFVLLRKFREK